MKLIDAIRLVERPEDPSRWAYSVDMEAICRSLDIPELWDQHDKVDERIREYPLATWYCTDTHVGLFAIWFDDRPVASAFQPARKSDKTIQWVSVKDAEEVRNFFLSLLPKPDFHLLDPNEDLGEHWNVGYVDQPLTDDGFYQGRPVKILVRYDGIMCRTTKPEHRRPDRSYYEKVDYSDPRRGHVLVQDGNEERLIPIEEFGIPFKVKQDA
jgi:hypothetical protein